ncbi:MAG TPA: response regulator [Ktedonobacterales bacterium]|jgi:CheY-like chemotaxis protein
MTWILVVDDDAPTRDTVRLVLEDAGYHVLEASDGGGALSKLAGASLPLVALIDLLMPGMDGIDLLRSIVADTRLAARHRYIGMTAAVGPVTPQAEALLGQLRGTLLAKPFGMDTLLDAVALASESLDALGQQTTSQ